ncbi:MAG: GHKL domain-containing protein [Clostridiales bacterium]|nr:GHKL domain-containing protein [Clostridiales bacterium]
MNDTALFEATELLDWISIILNYSQYVIALLLVVLIAACFLGRTVVLSKKLVLMAFGLFALCGITSVIENILFIEDEEIIKLISYVLTAGMYFYAFLFYLFAFREKRVIRAIESAVCYFVLTVYITNFSYMIVIYLIGGTEEALNSVYKENFGTGILWFAVNCIAFMIFAVLLIIVYFGFFKPKKFTVLNIPDRILFVVWTAFFIFVPFMPAVIPDEDINLEFRYHFLSILFAIGIILLGLAAPVFVLAFATDRSLREKNKAQESYITAELEYIEQYKRKQTETRAFRHDINNNLAITQMLLEEGHIDKAKEHVNDMLGNISSLSPKFVTGDETLDIIISMKADKMDEKNIKFTLDGVAESGLNMKPMDMCSIFANALDNAIEAASACKDPFVSFSIKRTDKFNIIKITNSATGKIDAEKLLSSSGYTSKKDKDHHGFGLMNIKRAVEDNDGIIKAKSENNEFTLSIMMPRSN